MSKELQPIDVTQLVEYTKKISEIGSLNKLMAPNYLRDFINAMDLTSSMLSKATKANIDAHTKLKTAEAVAYLDKAGDYLTSQGIKDTAEARKRYVDVDPDVIAARERSASTEAMVTFLKNKYQAFRCAHDDVKKISFNEVQGTAFEGF
jgi:3D (Asp-Asp-Asp) domain-containing protein